MSGLGSGLVNLFKSWGKGIGKAADNFLLKADARKAISDEVGKKFQHRIDFANKAASRRAANIKDLDAKLTQSKKDLADAQKAWQDNYDSALAGAKNQRQTDIAAYDTKLQGYQNALADANRGKQDILDQLYDQEATYTPTKTIYTDVKSGDKYIVDPITGKYRNITQIFSNANVSRKQRQAISKYIKDFDERLLDTSSGTPKVINAFDATTQKSYHNNSIFDNYLGRVQSSRNGDIRNADSKITQATDDLNTWQKNTRPADWNDVTDSKTFKTTYEKTNGKLPKEYSFNGQAYSKEKDLEDAYQKALDNEKAIRDLDSKIASKYTSKRDAEIAQRIQDAKDIKKAKLALGGALGAGALYAGAKALYGGDDTPDNIDNTNNIDNTDNTYTGEHDPAFNVEKEGQAIEKDKYQLDTGFDPDKADAVATLAAAAHDTGVEDSNSIESSDDHFIDDDDELYGLLKAMKDPYKADAVANYIYSKHGNESDVQNLGWRGWLNKYYGDLLRSRMGLDPSSYKGMHISGGL